LFVNQHTFTCLDTGKNKILWRENLDLKNRESLEWKTSKRRIKNFIVKRRNITEIKNPTFYGPSFLDSKYYFKADPENGEIIIGDLLTGKQLHRWSFKEDEDVYHIMFPSARIGIVDLLDHENDSDETIQRRKIEDGSVVWSYDYDLQEWEASNNGRYLFLCHRIKGVTLLDIMTGEVIWKGKQTVKARHPIFDRSDKFVITYDNVSDTYLYIWNTEDGSVYYTEWQSFDYIEPSPDGRYLLFVKDKEMSLFDLLRKRRVWENKEGKRSISTVKFSADMSSIYALCESSVMRIISTLTGDELKSLEISPIADNKLNASEISPDGQYAVFAGDGLFLKDLRNGSLVWQKFMKNKDFSCTSFSNDGKMLACSMVPGIIKVRETKSGKLKWTEKAHDPSKGKKYDTGAINDIAFSHDDSEIAFCCEKRWVKVLNAEDGETIWQARKHKESVNGVSFSFDDKKVISGGNKGKIFCYSAEDGKVLWSVRVKDKECKVIEASPTAPKFAVLSKNLEEKEMLIEMRNLSDGSLIWKKTEGLTSKFDNTRVYLTFSPQGDKLAYSYRNDLVIRNSNDGGEIRRITICAWLCKTTNALLGLAFDESGRFIYTTLVDGTIRKYEL